MTGQVAFIQMRPWRRNERLAAPEIPRHSSGGSTELRLDTTSSVRSVIKSEEVKSTCAAQPGRRRERAGRRPVHRLFVGAHRSPSPEVWLESSWWWASSGDRWPRIDYPPAFSVPAMKKRSSTIRIFLCFQFRSPKCIPVSLNSQTALSLRDQKPPLHEAIAMVRPVHEIERRSDASPASHLPPQEKHTSPKNRVWSSGRRKAAQTDTVGRTSGRHRPLHGKDSPTKCLLGEAGSEGCQERGRRSWPRNVKDVEESGFYIFPAPEERPGMTSDEKKKAMEAVMQKWKAGPVGIMVLQANGAEGDSPAHLISQCVFDIWRCPRRISLRATARQLPGASRIRNAARPVPDPARRPAFVELVRLPDGLHVRAIRHAHRRVPDRRISGTPGTSGQSSLESASRWRYAGGRVFSASGSVRASLPRVGCTSRSLKPQTRATQIDLIPSRSFSPRRSPDGTSIDRPAPRNTRVPNSLPVVAQPVLSLVNSNVRVPPRDGRVDFARAFFEDHIVAAHHAMIRVGQFRKAAQVRARAIQPVLLVLRLAFDRHQAARRPWLGVHSGTCFGASTAYSI